MLVRGAGREMNQCAKGNTLSLEVAVGLALVPSAVTVTDRRVPGESVMGRGVWPEAHWESSSVKIGTCADHGTTDHALGNGVRSGNAGRRAIVGNGHPVELAHAASKLWTRIGVKLTNARGAHEIHEGGCGALRGFATRRVNTQIVCPKVVDDKNVLVTGDAGQLLASRVEVIGSHTVAEFGDELADRTATMCRFPLHFRSSADGTPPVLGLMRH